MKLDEIQEKMYEMQDLFFEFEEAIEEFTNNPTVSNRRYTIEKGMFFNNKKNRLMKEIREFWCKGE